MNDSRASPSDSAEHLGRFTGGCSKRKRATRRHYLDLAEHFANATSEETHGFDTRLCVFVGQDRDLVTTPDAQFRFHSGPPAENATA